MWKFLLIVCIVLSSCETFNSTSPTSSSTPSTYSSQSSVEEPCEYYKQPFSMAITEIRPFGQNFHIMLDHKGHQYVLSELLKQPTDSFFIQRNNIAVGKVLTGTEKSITQGNCPPEVFDFDTKFVFSQ